MTYQKRALLDNYRPAYLAVLLMMLLFTGAYAQKYEPYPLRGKHRAIWVDSTFRLPYGTTPALNESIHTDKPGALFYRTSDSSIYADAGNGVWVKQRGGSGSAGSGILYNFPSPFVVNGGTVTLPSFPWSAISGKPVVITVSDTTAMLAGYARKLALSDTAASLRALIAQIQAVVADSTIFTSGLLKTGNQVVALHDNALWNARRIQGYLMQARQPLNNEIWVFSDTTNTWKLRKLSDLVTGGPGTGAPQVQSDWAQTNSSAVNFIQNKPNKYTQQFIGNSTHQFTLTSTPLNLQRVEVYVNTAKIPLSCYSLSVNTILINAGLLGYTLNSSDVVEIIYESTL